MQLVVASPAVRALDRAPAPVRPPPSRPFFAGLDVPSETALQLPIGWSNCLVGITRGGVRPHRPPIPRLESRPRRPGPRSGRLSVVQLRGLCPWSIEPADHPPSKRSGAEPVREGPPATLPRHPRCPRTPRRHPGSALDHGACRRQCRVPHPRRSAAPVSSRKNSRGQCVKSMTWPPSGTRYPHGRCNQVISAPMSHSPLDLRALVREEGELVRPVGFMCARGGRRIRGGKVLIHRKAAPRLVLWAGLHDARQGGLGLWC